MIPIIIDAVHDITINIIQPDESLVRVVFPKDTPTLANGFEITGELHAYYTDTAAFEQMFTIQDKYAVVGANSDEPLPGYHATFCTQCGRQHDVAFCVRSSRAKNFEYKGRRK